MTVHVDTSGLRAMAACCDQHAATVQSAAASPPPAAAPGQLTAAAVSAVHGLTSATGSFLGMRLVASSAAAQLAATTFDDTEAANQAAVRTVP